MKCSQCETEGTKALIVAMTRTPFCDSCYAARVAPPKVRSVSESQMLADLSTVDLGVDHDLVGVLTGTVAMHWELSLVRSSLRAIWIAKGFGRAHRS